MQPKKIIYDDLQVKQIVTSAFEEIDREAFQAFFHDCLEHLSLIEDGLLALEKDFSNRQVLDTLFRSLHTIKGISALLGLNHLRDLAHEVESLLDMGRQSKVTLTVPALEVIFDSVDVIKEIIADLSAFFHDNESVGLPKNFEQTLEQIKEEVIQSQKHSNAIPAKPATPLQVAIIEADDVPENELHQNLISQSNNQVATIVKKESNDSANKDMVRIEAVRLDRLIEMIGELVITKSMILQTWQDDNDSVNQEHLHLRLDKICRELQDTTTSLRMLSLKAMFRQMKRLARDLTKQTEKKFKFSTSGEDCELDKSVVEQLSDPIIHLIRNAVDHGLEKDEETRIKSGKSPIGNVSLCAFHQGENVCIEISDDGRGLDRAKVLAKAVSQGLASSDTVLDDEAVYNLIFKPGFSTADTLTSLSGRGVGMDVVSRSIKNMRGSVTIKNEEGKGCKFSIMLPLTLAIIDALVLRIRNERYIVPAGSVIRISRMSSNGIVAMHNGKEMIRSFGQMIQLARLSSILHSGENIEVEEVLTVIEVEYAHRKVGLIVDEILGQQQVVIKPLGMSFSHDTCVSGSAILPDGRVVLILDIAMISKFISS